MPPRNNSFSHPNLHSLRESVTIMPSHRGSYNAGRSAVSQSSQNNSGRLYARAVQNAHFQNKRKIHSQSGTGVNSTRNSESNEMLGEHHSPSAAHYQTMKSTMKTKRPLKPPNYSGPSESATPVKEASPKDSEKSDGTQTPATSPNSVMYRTPPLASPVPVTPPSPKSPGKEEMRQPGDYRFPQQHPFRPTPSDPAISPGPAVPPSDVSEAPTNESSQATIPRAHTRAKRNVQWQMPVAPVEENKEPTQRRGNNNYSFSSSSSSSSSFAESSSHALEWRQHGKMKRARLVLEDEERGGDQFNLSQDCSIERYYRVAERVLEQFLSTSIKTAQETELCEAYLIGNRLVKFMSIILPTHSEYFSTDRKLQALRKRSQDQLIDLLQYIEEVALVIDEIEYNKYITRDLTPSEKHLVMGLTGGGKGVSRWTQAEKEVALYTLRKWTQDNSSKDKPRSMTSIAPSPSRDETHVTVPTLTRQSTTKEAPEPRTNNHQLHDRVAEVVRMTEAFGDTYEVTNNNGGPNMLLKRSLMTAALSLKRDGHAAKSSSSTSQAHLPRVKPQQTQLPPQNADKKTRSPAPPDPSFDELSSVGSDEFCAVATDANDADTDAVSSSWDANKADVAFGATISESKSQIDLLEQKCDGANVGKDVSQCNRNDRLIPAAKSPKVLVPRLRRPPAAPSRVDRARAAAAIQYDELYSRHVPVRGPAAYSTGRRLLNSGPRSDEFDDCKLETKIEKRWKRAMQSKHELDLMDDQDVDMYFEQWQRQGMPTAHAPNPLNPFNDDADMSNSLAEDGLAEERSSLSKDRRLLHHFKGCVKCLLD